MFLQRLGSARTTWVQKVPPQGCLAPPSSSQEDSPEDHASEETESALQPSAAAKPPDWNWARSGRTSSTLRTKSLAIRHNFPSGKATGNKSDAPLSISIIAARSRATRRPWRCPSSMVVDSRTRACLAPIFGATFRITRFVNAFFTGKRCRRSSRKYASNRQLLPDRRAQVPHHCSQNHRVRCRHARPRGG